jgi:hypothetical protein
MTAFKLVNLDVVFTEQVYREQGSAPKGSMLLFSSGYVLYILFSGKKIRPLSGIVEN